MDESPTNKTERIHARLKPRDRLEVERAAEASEEKLSEWVRRELIAAARRTLERKARKAA